jgi:uncharacterized membrane protein
MGQVLWLIIALAVGAILGTAVRPGISEIAICAMGLAGLAYTYRWWNQRNHRLVKA